MAVGRQQAMLIATEQWVVFSMRSTPRDYTYKWREDGFEFNLSAQRVLLSLETAFLNGVEIFSPIVRI
jgi:hypothetical protein